MRKVFYLIVLMAVLGLFVFSCQYSPNPVKSIEALTTFSIMENPSIGDDKVYSIAVDANYIYLAGWDSSPGNAQWRIEKRDIITGGF